jgi:hypothetical protein
MSYIDNEYKFIVVLNKKIEISKLLNALGHMAAGLVSTSSNINDMRFLKYEDADGGVHPAISFYPFVILEADNSNQIRLLRQKAIENKILYNDFVKQMLAGSADEQLQQTKSTKDEALEYFGICLFGPATILRDITKKFSLFR